MRGIPILVIPLFYTLIQSALRYDRALLCPESPVPASRYCSAYAFCGCSRFHGELSGPVVSFLLLPQASLLIHRLVLRIVFWYCSYDFDFLS